MQIIDKTGLTKEQWEKRFPNFTKDEISCSHCGLLNPDLNFLDKVQKARFCANTPFIVNSFCRCEKHNKAVGGKSKSYHLKGQAIDIHIENAFERLKIILGLIEASILHILLYPNFIHASAKKKSGIHIMKKNKTSVGNSTISMPPDTC